MSSSPAITTEIPLKLMLRLKQEAAFLKSLERRDAERRRARTQKLVEGMANSTAEGRIVAAKAQARAVHAQIDDISAQSDLAASQDSPAAESQVGVSEVRVDDLDALFAIREELPDWLHERVKKVHAKINWKTRKDKKGFFNVAVHQNHIPLDKGLTIIAHLHNIPDENGLSLNAWVDSVIECGLFPRLKLGKFAYVRRCQDGEHCDLCSYVNISDGLKTLFAAYSATAFHRAGHMYAITVAPRTSRAAARAVGRTLVPTDWDYDNPESAVYRESRHGRAFVYPSPLDDGMDWALQSTIRRFLGAVQFTFGKLVKNGWVDGIRARVENSVEFLPFKSHQHWHAVGSSRSEHDPQKMAEFIKRDVDLILAQTCTGLYADVLVAVILAPEDLRRWIKYSQKPVDLVGPVASVYNRYPGLHRVDSIFKKFIEELRLYPQRTREVFKGARLQLFGEQGAHTYTLRRHYVRGNHKFGRGSILTEPERHRLWRKAHREATQRRRALKGGTGIGAARSQRAKKDPEWQESSS